MERSRGDLLENRYSLDNGHSEMLLLILKDSNRTETEAKCQQPELQGSLKFGPDFKSFKMECTWLLNFITKEWNTNTEFLFKMLFYGSELSALLWDETSFNNLGVSISNFDSICFYINFL